MWWGCELSLGQGAFGDSLFTCTMKTMRCAASLLTGLVLTATQIFYVIFISVEVSIFLDLEKGRKRQFSTAYCHISSRAISS